MFVPGTSREPADPTDWKFMPVTPPAGIDIFDRDQVIDALKSEGFLHPQAACEMPDISLRLQGPLLSGLLAMARELPAPFLAEPIADYRSQPMANSLTTVGQFVPARNEMQVNPLHEIFGRARTDDLSSAAWERLTNFLQGHARHESVHKAQAHQSPQAKAQIDAAIAEATGDWRNAFPNAFADIGAAFAASYGDYGRTLLVERDAVVMQFQAHGLHTPWTKAIAGAYEHLHGSRALAQRQSALTLPSSYAVRERRPVRVGPKSPGVEAARLGETLDMNERSVYYVRAGDRRYIIASSRIIDVDESIRRSKLVEAPLGEHPSMLLEVGAPLSRKDGFYLPPEMVTAIVDEVVEVTYDHAERYLLRSQDIPGCTRLVLDIERNLMPLKATLLRPVPSSDRVNVTMRPDHTFEWAVSDETALAKLNSLLPHATLVTLRTATGQEASFHPRDGYASTRSIDGEGIPHTAYSWIDAPEVLRAIRIGQPLTVSDTKTGEAIEWGDIASVRVSEQTLHPAALIERWVVGRELSSRRDTAAPSHVLE